jgi:predicted DNA-binding protein with PD1-like motif
MARWLTVPVAAALVLVCILTAPAPGSPAVTALPGARIKLIGEQGGTREYQLVFESGGEIMATLTDFILRNHFKSVHFTGLGACSDAIVGYYDPSARDYRRTPYQQQMEIVSLIGDAAPTNGGAGLHVHIGLAFADGTMHGGHLFEAHASPTLELFLIASPTPVERKHDAALNLDLLVP